MSLFSQTLQAGGARRDRTDDLLNANQALSQLSYGPNRCEAMPLSDHFWKISDFWKIMRTMKNGGPGTTRTYDLTLIRGAL